MAVGFREILAAHVAQAADDLRRYPRLRPLPEQERLIRAVLADARRVGKTLPPDLLVVTVQAPPDRSVARGMTFLYRDSGRIEVWLDVNTITPVSLISTTYHEASHASDFARGDFDKLAGEERALAFSAWAMERW